MKLTHTPRRPKPPRRTRTRTPARTRDGHSRIAVYLLRHAESLFSSLGRLWRSPVASLMTIAVIGIALALPAGLQVLLDHARQISGSWDGSPQVSLFLHQAASADEARALAAELRANPATAEVTLIPRDAALAEFRALSGFGDALDAFDTNPLPDVIVVRPADPAPDAANRLRTQLAALPAVDIAQLDMEWVRRLHAIMEIVDRMVLVIAGLLGMAVLLIVGNTLRLDIQNRRREIEVTKLIGGTNAFIRRPFLYGGLWYGLFGGLAAWLLVSAALWATSGPVARLATLYQSGFHLGIMDADTVWLLLAGGALLGLTGAWLTVDHHLRRIEPS